MNYNNYSYNQTAPVFLVKLSSFFLVRWRWIVSVIIGVAGTYVFINFGFIEVKVTDSTPSTIYVQSQSNTDTIYETRNTIHMKKFVKKGSYEISVFSGDHNSGFAVKTTGGFMKTTTVSLDQKPEEFREFVADSPNVCMTIPNKLLVSVPCGLSNIKTRIHSAATISSANTINEITTPLTVIQVLQTTNEVIVIGIEPDHDENTLVGYNIDKLGNFINRRQFKKINTFNYGVSTSGNGFLLYSADFNDIEFYEDLNSAPTNLEVEVPKNDKEEAITSLSLESNGSSIISLYSQYFISGDTGPGEYEGEGSDEDVDIEEADSFVVITKDSQSTTYKVASTATQAFFCEELICLVENDTLTFYEETGDKLVKVYVVKNIQDIRIGDTKVLVVTNRGVLNFNPSSRNGHFIYTFGEYLYCGSSLIPNKLLLCINDGLEKNRSRRVLQITLDKPAKDQVDKQVFKMLEIDQISSLAAYREYIHLAVNTNFLGELVPISNSRSFGYSKQNIDNLNKSIDDKVNEINLNTDYYKVINPFL